MDESVYMAVKLTFKVYWHYDKMAELAKKLGIERELRQEGFAAKFVAAMHPRVEFTLWNQDTRAIFLHAEPAEENLYSIIIPDNRLLYSKIYSLLKNHNLPVRGRMVDLSETGVPQPLYGLLKRY